MNQWPSPLKRSQQQGIYCQYILIHLTLCLHAFSFAPNPITIWEYVSFMHSSAVESVYFVIAESLRTARPAHDECSHYCRFEGVIGRCWEMGRTSRVLWVADEVFLLGTSLSLVPNGRNGWSQGITAAVCDEACLQRYLRARQGDVRQAAARSGQK